MKAFLTTLILSALVLSFSCGKQPIIEAPRKAIISWNPPADFRPSYITQDQDSVYWGLFISKMYSAKFNLWTVKSTDRQNWVSPVLIDNAYYFGSLDFSVMNDSLHLTYYEIDPGYFPDHGLGLGAFVDYKDEMKLAYDIRDLTRDRDHDGIPDNVERELLTSPRLPDTDLDGKIDYFDTNPLAKPREQSNNHEIYTAILHDIVKTSGLDTIPVARDTAWSKFYRIYVLSGPSPLYLAFSSEQKTFEMVVFPMTLISVKTPLWFGSRPEYRSVSGGIIPHINFKNIKYKFLGNTASAYVEFYINEEQITNYQFDLKKEKGEWRVKGSYLLEEEEGKEQKDTTATLPQE
jgi:hypothetical protein